MRSYTEDLQGVRDRRRPARDRTRRTRDELSNVCSPEKRRSSRNWCRGIRTRSMPSFFDRPVIRPSRAILPRFLCQAYRHLAGFRGDALRHLDYPDRHECDEELSFVARPSRAASFDGARCGHEIPAAEAEQSILNEALHLNLRKHVQELRPKYRDVLVLCAFENKSFHKEAAEILEVPLGTICSRMNTAINLLRRKFRLG